MTRRNSPFLAWVCVRIESVHALPDIQVDVFRFLRLEIGHEEQFIPDAVLVDIVHLVFEEMAVGFLAFQISARRSKFRVGRIGFPRQGWIRLR